jgi:uncharacterized DUF497 family protein
MRFEWDEEKRRVNLEKHGIDFVDAFKLFNRPVIVSQDQKKDYGEKRFACYGYLGEIFVALAFTRREPDIIRVISLRKANRRERRRYEEAIAD